MFNLCYDNEDILEPLVVGINRHLGTVEDGLKALEDVAFQFTQTDFDWSSVQASRMDFPCEEEVDAPGGPADTDIPTCNPHMQKHKRGKPTTHPITLPNSRAGPYKCGRINPSTGKPYNSIFSRPYDLTRHEDTIHKPRRQKIRCHLCTEEKTYSRNDVLRRHMRVVHPDVYIETI